VREIFLADYGKASGGPELGQPTEMIVNALGGGLVVAGAVILLADLVLPADLSRLPLAEANRRHRNSRATTISGTTLTLTGSALVLARSPWWPGLGGVAAALLLWWFVLAMKTHSAYAQARNQIETAWTSHGMVSIGLAHWIGFGVVSETDQPLAQQATEDPDEVLARARRRARWRWALRHPLGARYGGL
jgi:hypothetical protein